MNNLHSVFNLARHLENHLKNLFPSSSEWITHSVKVVKGFSLPGQQSQIIGLALFIAGNALIFNLSHRMADAIPLESYRFLYDGIITGASILVCNIALSYFTQYPLSNLTLGLITATAVALRIFMNYYQSTATHKKGEKIEEKAKTKVKDLKNIKETEEQKAKLIEVEKQKKLEAEKKAKLKVEQAYEAAKKLKETEEEKAKIEAENLKKAKEVEAAEKEDKLKAQQESEAARKTLETEEEKGKKTQGEAETQNLQPLEEESKKLVEVDKQKVVEAVEARLKAQQDSGAPKKDQEAEEDKTNNANLEKGLIKVIEAKEEVDKIKLAEAAEARLKVKQDPEASKKAQETKDLTKVKEAEEEAKKLAESEKTKRLAALETRLKAEKDAKAARQVQEEERAKVVQLEREEQEKKVQRIQQIQEAQKLRKTDAEKMVPPPFEFAVIKKTCSTEQARVLITCQNNADLQKLFEKFKYGTSTFVSCVFDKVGSQSITTGATKLIVRLSSDSQNQNPIEQDILTYLNQLSGTLCPEIDDKEIIPKGEEIITKDEQPIK